jgi:methyl-accepting chemotaxis protein
MTKRSIQTDEHAEVVRRITWLMTLALSGILVIIVLASLSAGRTRDEARSFSTVDVPALLALGDAGQSLLEAETALLVATRVAGDAQLTALADYNRELVEVADAIGLFRELTDGDDVSAALADDAVTAFESWVSVVDVIAAEPLRRTDNVRFAAADFSVVREAVDAIAADVSSRRVDVFQASIGEAERDAIALRYASLILLPLAALWSYRVIRRVREILHEGRERQRIATQEILKTSAQAGQLSTKVAGTATELGGLSDDLLRTAGATAASASDMLGMSDEVDEHVTSVAAAMEEMTAAISEIAGHVSEASGVTTNAVAAARTTTTTMAALDAASREIGEVVQLIASIAEQTNLLALNATIEAARAGEHGKGFAVVASEVKELARETARATSVIGGRIEAIQATTTASTAEIDAVGEVIDHIAELQSMIAAAVEEQSAASNEISRMLQRASSGTSEIATSASNVADAARDNHDSADQVRSTAGQLTSLAQTLRRVAQAASEGRSTEVWSSDGLEPHEPQGRFVTEESADTASISSHIDDSHIDDADAAATRTRRLARRSPASAISHEPTRGPRTTRNQPHLR